MYVARQLSNHDMWISTLIFYVKLITIINIFSLLFKEAGNTLSCDVIRAFHRIKYINDYEILFSVFDTTSTIVWYFKVSVFDDTGIGISYFRPVKFVKFVVVSVFVLLCPSSLVFSNGILKDWK